MKPGLLTRELTELDSEHEARVSESTAELATRASCADP